MSTGKKNQINKAATEQQQDEAAANSRYRWGAAAREQLQLTGCPNDLRRAAKLRWNSNFNLSFLSLCLKAQQHVGPLPSPLRYELPTALLHLHPWCQGGSELQLYLHKTKANAGKLSAADTGARRALGYSFIHRQLPASFHFTKDAGSPHQRMEASPRSLLSLQSTADEG